MQKLGEVMTKKVQVISPDATIREAARQMRGGDFGMMPVGENDRKIGSISDRDIAIRAIAEGKESNSKVRDVMTKGIVWAYEGTTYVAPRASMDTTASALPGAGAAGGGGAGAVRR